MRIAVAGGTGVVGRHVVEVAEQNAFGIGPWVFVPKIQSKPVAARSIVTRLVDLTEGEPKGYATELAGPDELWMADLARMVFETRGERRTVFQMPIPGKLGRAIRTGGILPGTGADIDSMSYEEWLTELGRDVTK